MKAGIDLNKEKPLFIRVVEFKENDEVYNHFWAVKKNKKTGELSVLWRIKYQDGKKEFNEITKPNLKLEEAIEMIGNGIDSLAKELEMTFDKGYKIPESNQTLDEIVEALKITDLFNFKWGK